MGNGQTGHLVARAVVMASRIELERVRTKLWDVQLMHLKENHVF